MSAWPSGSPSSTATTLAARADVPEPRVPALGPVGRSQGQQLPARPAASPADHLGPARGRERSVALLLLRPPVHRALGRPSSRTSSTPLAGYFTTAPPGRCRTCLPRPEFSGDEQCDDHPLADIRRGQPSSVAVKAFAESPNWQSGLFVADLRRVGRLLRPRAGRRRARRPRQRPSTRTNFGQARLPRPDASSLAVRPPGLRRPPDSTSTPRSCASSSGASSVRRRTGPVAGGATGGSRAGISMPTTSAGACGRDGPIRRSTCPKRRWRRRSHAPPARRGSRRSIVR